MYQLTRKKKARERQSSSRIKNGRETKIYRAKMAEVSKIITEKQDDPWNVERLGQDAKKNWGKVLLPIEK